LLEEKAKNRKIVLATASHEKYAKNVCDEYDLFDSFISSDINSNLKGEAKLLRIQSETKKFSYAGNSKEDFVIFDRSEESYLVNPTNNAKKLAVNSPTSKTFDDTPMTWMVWFRQLRVHQWAKNFLIFVPLIVSGQFLVENSILSSVLGFISFSCLASATYIINDLIDLECDRRHPRKKNRPLAAGKISVVYANVAAFVLFFLAFTIASVLMDEFILVLAVYLIMTVTYSLKIKQYIGMDVIALASLYTLRIIAGAAILSVTLSFWLLSFSMFVFLSLAMIKRCAELKSFKREPNARISGRGYELADYFVLMSIGTSSAMLSILMFCFYINSNVLTDQYQKPILLWLVLPAFCYWMMIMWLKTNSGEMHDDPLVFSLKNKGSIVTIGFMGIIALLAQVL
ncbi:hypothetical protein A9Q78_01770, partial [Methylophaga sp. 41_12_T18]